jgi:hypothetical protein
VTSGAGTTYNIPHGLNTTPDYAVLTSQGPALRPLVVTGMDATNIAVLTDAVYAAFTIHWTAMKKRGF